MLFYSNILMVMVKCSRHNSCRLQQLDVWIDLVSLFIGCILWLSGLVTLYLVVIFFLYENL